MRNLEATIDQLLDAGLVRPATASPGEYLIRHELLQDTVYSSILRRERKQIHLEVGEVLRRQQPEETIAAELAYHFERAEQSDLAFKFHLLAADLAYEQYANYEAVEHYRRAFKFLDPEGLERDELIRVHRYYGRALELVGEFERTLRVLDRLIDHAEARQDPAMKTIAMIGKARLMATMTPVRDPDSAKSLAEQALSLARDQGDLAAEVRALWVLLLREMYHEVDLDTAERYGLEALKKARQLGEDRPLALVITDLARLYMTRGQPGKGLEIVDEGQALWKRDGNLVMQVDVLSLVGGLSLVTGDLERSRTAFGEALRLSEEIDNPWGAAVAEANTALTDHMQGRTGEALARLERSREIGERANIPAAKHITAFFTTWILPDLGAVEEGIRFSRQVLEKGSDLMPWHRALVLGNWARLEIQRGDVEQARRLLERAHNMQEKGRSVGWLFDPLPMAEIELASAESDYRRALEMSQTLLEKMEARGSTAFVPEVLCHIASNHIELDRLDAALGALQRARDLAEEMGMRRDLWRIHVEAARAHARAGREEAAEKARRFARAELEFVLEHIEDPSLTESFRSRPLVGEVLDAEDGSG